jgi:hypothetical protein
MSDTRFEETAEKFEVFDSESESISATKSDLEDVPEDLPENHTSLVAGVDVDALEYEPSSLESLATDLPGLGAAMYIGAGGEAGLLAELLSSSSNPEWILGGAGAGLALWAGIATKTAYNDFKKSSAEDDVGNVYLVDDQEAEEFLEKQDRVIVDFEGTAEIWSGEDVVDLYSDLEEEISLTTFEEYSGKEVDYQIDIHPAEVTFYGWTDEGLEYFDNPASVKQDFKEIENILE